VRSTSRPAWDSATSGPKWSNS